MIDGIIKADGTSRLMRAELPATYEEFRAQCHAGAQPLDVLFNSAGWSQLPTFLNKANLLKDTTASLFGLDANAVPDEVLALIPEQINEKARIATGSYTGTGKGGASYPNTASVDFDAKAIILMEVSEPPAYEYYSFMMIATKERTAAKVRREASTNDGTYVASCTNTFSFSGGNISWYVSATSMNSLSVVKNQQEFQFNSSGRTYYYIIFG